MGRNVQKTFSFREYGGRALEEAILWRRKQLWQK
jgi:hypothetical protein